MSDSIDNDGAAGGFADAGNASASFDGSVSAVDGRGSFGGADFGASGNDTSGGGTSIGTGSGDFGLGGPGPMETTAADYGALSTIAAAGLLQGFGMSGWSGATLAMANTIAAAYGTSLDVALGHLSHDIAASVAWGGQGALSSGQ
jgi:hypothetical protein